MQILLDQAAGSHHFIFCYNWLWWSNDLLSFQLAMSSKLRSQSIFYLFTFKFLPLRTKFLESIKSLSWDGKYIVHPLLTNNSCKLLPEISIRALKISIKNLWIFLCWIQKDFSLSNNWTNVESLSQEKS